jgi:glycosyltransferase involved in cell wall biosynthesis
MNAPRICLLIPHYEHARAIGPLLERLEPYGLPCVLVDDGSGPAARETIRALEAKHAWVTVLWRETNGGQGAAKRSGYAHALAAGYTHAIEMDADGQHHSEDIPRFLAAIRAHPSAAIFGKPLFGDDVPKARLWGRQLSRGLVWLACGSTAIDDPLCGYRAIPLARAVEVVSSSHTGDRMSHDPEFAVRLYRAGLPVVILPTRVSYPSDGVSHFDMLRDNLRLAATYVRLLAELPLAAPSIVLARRRAAALAAADAAAARAATTEEGVPRDNGALRAAGGR